MIAAERERLAGPWLIVAFASVFAGMLAAVFPTREEYADFASIQQADAFSVAYLGALSRANPSDDKLRFAHARHLAQVGRAGDALDVLHSIENRRSWDGAAHDLEFDLAFALFHEASTEAGRQQARDLAVTKLRDLAALPHAPDRLRTLADAALEFERPDLAARILVDLARTSDDSPLVLAEAARWFRAAGNEGAAADAYLAAMKGEPVREKAQPYAEGAVAALRGASRVCEASEIAAGLGREHWDDLESVERGMQLAAECGSAKLARDFGRRILELSPGSDDLLFDQTKRELAANDLAAAFALLQVLIQHQPDEPSLREIRGRVSEWAGHPDVALGDWLYLMGRPAGASRRYELP